MLHSTRSMMHHAYKRTHRRKSCEIMLMWTRRKVSPARIFKSPMDVVEANDIGPGEKLAILQAWEADERALLRAEDEGMGGGEHAHLHKVQAALDHLK